MTIVFVCGGPVVNASILPSFTATYLSNSWCDGMQCHCLLYMVTPNINPWHIDSPAGHPSAICVATHDSCPRSYVSIRQFSATHSIDISRLPPPHYHPSLARFVVNRAYLRSFGTASWTTYEFDRTRGTFTSAVD
ncbi:hypothetical protein TNCV_3528461 [Trichonephila clavipes]|nr:hypothetical protein TNCV_3528461 [Trichonephila clavipes]